MAKAFCRTRRVCGESEQGGRAGFRDEGDFGDVAGGARLAADAFAEVIEDDVVIARPCGSAAGNAARRTFAGGRIRENSVEGFDQFDYPHGQAGLFLQFAGHAGVQRLAGFEQAAGNRPLAAQRFGAAAHQQGAAVVDDHAADANQRPLRVFTIGHALTRGDAPRVYNTLAGSKHHLVARRFRLWFVARNVPWKLT